MLISIITVTYNNIKGLESTIKSVDSQTNKNFEFIVVDGASSDGSLELIKKYDHVITRWLSEPDSGIYNAMNKGVKMATGEYCLFMNSGDLLYSSTTMEELISQNLDADFVEGRIAFGNSPGKYSNPPKKRTLWSYIYGFNNCHQASLISRELLLRIPYDESYKIAADLKFNMEAIICNNCSYKTIDTIVCNYEVGGRSATVSHEKEIARAYNELFPKRILEDYQMLIYHKFWPSRLFWHLAYKFAPCKNGYKFYLLLKKICMRKISLGEIQMLDTIADWKIKYLKR